MFIAINKFTQKLFILINTCHSERSEESLSIAPNIRGNAINGILQYGFLQLALPNDDDIPALRLQLSPDVLIPLLIPRNLSHPEFCVGFGDRIILTVFVAMPKAAVYKDSRPILW